MRRFFFGLIALSVFFVFPVFTSASGFQLKTIGGLNVDGVTYDHLWYSGESVVFTGISLENTQVTASIDGASETVTADSSGNWTYTKTLSTGDHQVSFTSQGSTVSLTLTIGDVPANVGGLSTSETPTVGTIMPTIVILSLGISLLIFPFILKKAPIRPS